jgi:Na+-transporting methylmalonyl-CoA/oxaloacetate decarboxylase gamma subunit
MVRAVFSVLGLLLVVLVISLLAKKQVAPMVALPQGPASAQQAPQQVQQAVDAALQQPRAMSDEKP